ncbi:MAG TPA: hypothetical protein PLZ57_09030 [Pseudobdellovibrionaceae bacterium]|nr:hypothetical protein [Pseudobdellovibrionaceae bacterium]
MADSHSQSEQTSRLSARALKSRWLKSRWLKALQSGLPPVASQIAPQILVQEFEWWRSARHEEGWGGALQARARVWARRGFARGVEWTAQSMGWKLRGRVGEVTWRETSGATPRGFYEVDVTHASVGAVLDAADLMLRRQLSEVFDLRVDAIGVESAHLQFHDLGGEGESSGGGLRLTPIPMSQGASQFSASDSMMADDRAWRVTLPWREADREQLRRELWRSADGQVRTQVTAHVFEIVVGEQVGRRIADVELNLVLMSGAARRVLGPTAQ